MKPHQAKPPHVGRVLHTTGSQLPAQWNRRDAWILSGSIWGVEWTWGF